MQISVSDYRNIVKSKTIIAKSVDELKKAIDSKKMQYFKILESNLDSINAPSIGLSPTMGALHNGHKSLIEQNVAQNHISITSIFVNPTQFSPNEDLQNYPRTLESDLEMCEKLGVDIVFVPEISQMYGENEIDILPPKNIGYILEGFYRPTHFAGVLQIIAKLLLLSGANKAYFGKKDAQQLLIIQKMAKDLFMKVEIIPVEIVRDSDNLALSSRNIYLDSNARKKALAIPKAIFFIESEIKKNVRDIETLKRGAREILKDLDIDYMDFYTHELKLANEVKNSIFLLAVRVKVMNNDIKQVRLLDNLWVE